MTTTDDRPARQVTINEAVASVIGYLSRQSGNLAMEYVTQGVAASSLDDLRAGLEVLVERVGGIAAALHRGETHFTYTGD